MFKNRFQLEWWHNASKLESCFTIIFERCENNFCPFERPFSCLTKSHFLYSAVPLVRLLKILINFSTAVTERCKKRTFSRLCRDDLLQKNFTPRDKPQKVSPSLFLTSHYKQHKFSKLLQFLPNSAGTPR